MTEPLREGYVRKGGRNSGPSQSTERPPPPPPFRVVRACSSEIFDALKIIRDLAVATEQPEQTRLNDIYDLANSIIEKIQRASATT